MSVKEFAIKKREKLGKNIREVDVTVAMIGDSRTGKSETAEKMERNSQYEYSVNKVLIYLE